MRLKVDLHVHSSSDPVDRLPLSEVETIERAAALGFDAIAFTHHDWVYQRNPEAERAAERLGLIVIPGVEATIEGGHVLIAGCGQEVAGVQTLAELEQVLTPQSAVIAAHPFYPGGTGLGMRRLRQWSRLFHGLEWSHFWTRAWTGPNLRAAAAAEQLGLALVGTGDVHLPDQMGCTYSVVEASERSAAGVVEAIQQGRVEVVSQPLELDHMLSIAARLAARNSLSHMRLYRWLRRLIPVPRIGRAAVALFDALNSDPSDPLAAVPRQVQSAVAPPRALRRNAA